MRLIYEATKGGHHVLRLEGRVAAILNEDVGDRSLAAPDSLVDAETAARSRAERLGIPFEGARPSVSRLDLAVDVAFDHGGDGLRILKALSVLEWPQHETVTVASRDLVESICWRLRSGIQFRAYDKGKERRERGNEPNGPSDGELVRLERQYRPSASKQRSPEQLVAGDWAPLFLKRFSSWNLDRLAVSGSWNDVTTVIVAMIKEGSLGPRKGERLLGSLLLVTEQGDDAFDRRTAGRRRTDLRKLGLAFSEKIGTGVVPVGAVLVAAREAWRR